MLDYVRIPESARRLRQYPHELSGGMRQRVMIAMATITGPDLIIADEPTTALDVTVQAQILEILRALKTERKTAIAMISHDMGVIAGMADWVQVMPAARSWKAAPWTRSSMRPKAIIPACCWRRSPRPAQPRRQLTAVGGPLLVVEDLKVTFPVKSGLFDKTQSCARWMA